MSVFLATSATRSSTLCSLRIHLSLHFSLPRRRRRRRRGFDELNLLVRAIGHSILDIELVLHAIHACDTRRSFVWVLFNCTIRVICLYDDRTYGYPTSSSSSCGQTENNRQVVASRTAIYDMIVHRETHTHKHTPHTPWQSPCSGTVKHKFIIFEYG